MLSLRVNFTDLDRARRQQAFIISMAYQLKQGGAFTNPARCAKQNTALDSHLDLLNFAKQVSNLTGGNVTFVTLPIDVMAPDHRVTPTLSAGLEITVPGEVSALRVRIRVVPVEAGGRRCAPCCLRPGSAAKVIS